MIRSLTSLSLFLLVSALLSLHSAVGQAPQSPDVLLIVADDLGYAEMSCQNPDTDIPTPHIDALAAAGVRFTNGYVTALFCAASRSGMMTGRDQTRFGFEFNPIGVRNEDPDAGRSQSEPTLAEDR